VKKNLLLCLTVSALTLPAYSVDFLDKLKNALPPAPGNKQASPPQTNAGRPDMPAAANGNMPAAAPTSAGGGMAGSVDEVCKVIFGKPFKEKKLSAAPEELVKKYFKVSADFDKVLYQGINAQYSGTLISISNHIDDLKEKNIKNLANSFIANPSLGMLAQVIEYAEKGDSFVPPRDPEPSERGDAQTLLAMVMMQYPQLLIDKAMVMNSLKLAEKGESGLGVVFIARAHMYGDYANQDMNAFAAYVGRASKKYQVKLATQSAFYAIEKAPPNWNARNNFIQLLQSGQEMQESFKRQQNAASAQGNDLNTKAIKLMEEGENIDQLTLEALGAGPKMAEIRAKGEMLKKEGNGTADVIKVKVYQSEQAANVVNDLLKANPKLDSEAKQKFEKANQIRLDNVTKLYNMVGEIGLQFFSGNMGQVLNTGPLVKQYHKNSCTLLYRQLEMAKMTGTPVQLKSNVDMQKDL
jgi:hypothetical protein